MVRPITVSERVNWAQAALMDCVCEVMCVCVGGLHTYISSNGTKALMKMISGVKATDWRGERRDS